MTTRKFACLCPLAMLLATALVAAPAALAQAPRLETNEAYIAEATRASTLAVDDPMAVLRFVLASLPDRVKVYPTENYYYFSFLAGGIRYAGNLRLAAAERDQGRVHFEYYQDRGGWSREGVAHTLVLGAAEGVGVERLEPYAYRVSYADRSVVFALNDLSLHKPPAGLVGGDEKLLGPIFDESGIRFFLVYNTRLKLFHYVLDESEGVADAFFPAKRTNRIVIGRRTGFAFYRDRRLNRKILIGVFEANAELNTYFDGPFDQLPENFIQGEELREAIIDSDPVVAGQIDRLGNFLDGSGRYLIQPYMLYRRESQLDVAQRCVEKSAAALYYRCFVLDNAGKGGLVGAPLAPRTTRHQAHAKDARK